MSWNPCARTVVASLAVVWAGVASAQTSAPPSRCAAMKDPVGCACALSTGGMVSGSSWARGSDQLAFEACLEGQGVKAPAKPANIPARR